MEKPSILVLTQYFPPEIGAPQSRLFETAIALKKRGWKVTIVTAMPNYPTGSIFKDYRGRFYVKEEIEGLTIHRFWLIASNSKRTIPRIISMLSFSISSIASLFMVKKMRPDYLLAESPPLTLGITGLWLARISGAKFILNISDIWPLTASELGAISNQTSIYRLLERLEQYLYRSSFICMGQSQEIVEHVTKNGAKNQLLFRNGVDSTRFRPEHFKSYSRPLKIVYAGLLGVAQGILSVCQNYKIDSAVCEFHIYGSGAEYDDIREYLEKNPGKGIFLHNAISRNDIPNTLVQYDLMLIPLVKPIYGAVPSKLYEALAAGLPVLFSGGGEGARIVDNQKLGWVFDPSDFNTMNSNLKRITEMSSEELNHYRDNCINAARTLFDRELQVVKLHEYLVTNLQ